jgi:putative flavoprotein involved in K+ transport
MSDSTIHAPDRSELDAVGVVTDWLKRFQAAIETGDVGQVLDQFAEDCWWRDLLLLTWDLRTMHGPDEVKSLVSDRLGEVGFSDFALDTSMPPRVVHGVVAAPFVFRTRIAVGRGYVRLRELDGAWRAWTVLTMLDSLVGHPERRTTLADTREPQMSGRAGRLSWYEFREQQREFENREPDVLVVGAGQAGLATAARLQHLGQDVLVAEKTARVGDVWRHRYHNLTLHTTSFFNEMPYLPYPDNWPVFPPKDLVADWLEAYAWMLQLNVWTSSQVEKATYEETSGRWDVVIDRDGVQRRVRPKAVVFATGAHSGDPEPPQIAGMEQFQGTILHSARYRGGDDGMAGKRVVVVGAGSSAIDIAQDAFDTGAEVTIVQRSGTVVMTFENGPHAGVDAMYGTGLRAEDADLMMLSMPFNLMLQELAPISQRRMDELNADLLEGLKAAGFEVSDGPFGSGHVGQTLYGGGSYIHTGDKNGLSLIIEGKIRVQRGSIDQFTPGGVVYTDGTEQAADMVVFATGFPNMRENLRPIVGDEVADRLSVVWGLDEEGEIRGLYRPSGHPWLWYIGGGFPDARWGSKLVAHQIVGAFVGLRETAPPSTVQQPNREHIADRTMPLASSPAARQVTGSL